MPKTFFFSISAINNIPIRGINVIIVARGNPNISLSPFQLQPILGKISDQIKSKQYDFENS